MWWRKQNNRQHLSVTGSKEVHAQLVHAIGFPPTKASASVILQTSPHFLWSNVPKLWLEMPWELQQNKGSLPRTKLKLQREVVCLKQRCSSNDMPLYQSPLMCLIMQYPLNCCRPGGRFEFRQMTESSLSVVQSIFMSFCFNTNHVFKYCIVNICLSDTMVI